MEGVEPFEFCNKTKQSENNKSKLDECIENIVRKEGYISSDIVKKDIPADGGNNYALLTIIDIKGKTVDGYKETAIFAKRVNSDCEDVELISLPDVYKTELYVYKELIQIFSELQDDANVPVDERYNTVKCFEESYETGIIMENVSKKGFKTAGHQQCVTTLIIAEACVKQLSKLHGLSYVLEHKKPEYFNEKIRPLTIPYNFGKAWNEYVENMTKMGLDCLDEKLRSQVEKKLPTIIKKLEEYYTDKSIKYCLCHGGYRPNNIMAKEVNGNVTIIPVDYQTIHYGCPVFDFIYFIYMATDRQFRNSHVVHLKNLYYKCLEDFLQLFNLSAESVFPKTAFDRIYREKLDFGLASMLICPLHIVNESADVANMTVPGIANCDLKLHNKYRERLTQAVEEFIDLGFL